LDGVAVIGSPLTMMQEFDVRRAFCENLSMMYRRYALGDICEDEHCGGCSLGQLVRLRLQSSTRTIL